MIDIIKEKLIKDILDKTTFEQCKVLLKKIDNWVESDNNATEIQLKEKMKKLCIGLPIGHLSLVQSGLNASIKKQKQLDELSEKEKYLKSVLSE